MLHVTSFLQWLYERSTTTFLNVKIVLMLYHICDGHSAPLLITARWNTEVNCPSKFTTNLHCGWCFHSCVKKQPWLTQHECFLQTTESLWRALTLTTTFVFTSWVNSQKLIHTAQHFKLKEKQLHKSVKLV